MSEPVACPTCGAEVQPDWDWCHACGWDPDGRLAASARRAAPVEAAPAPTGPQGSGRSTVVPLAIGAVVGLIGFLAVAIVAATLLGTSTGTSRFSSIETATPTTASTALPTPTPLDPANGTGDTVVGDWVWFIDERARFKIHFPVEPTVRDETPPLEHFANVSWIEAQDGGALYIVWVSELAPGFFFQEPTADVQSMVDSAGQLADVTFTSQTPGTLGSSTSLSFTGTAPGGFDVEGITFTQGEGQMYTLMTMAVGTSPVDHQRFVGSFEGF